MVLYLQGHFFMRTSNLKANIHTVPFPFVQNSYFEVCTVVSRRYLGEVRKFYGTSWLVIIWARHKIKVSGRIARTLLNGWVYLAGWFKYIQCENHCKYTKSTLKSRWAHSNVVWWNQTLTSPSQLSGTQLRGRFERRSYNPASDHNTDLVVFSNGEGMVEN